MKIKNSILAMIALLWLACPTYGTVSNHPQTVILGGQYDDPNEEYGHVQRAPIAPIYASQEEHRFVFNASLAGETIQILAGDTLLYTDVIGADGCVTVPEDITGEVELRLVRGSLTYHAVVEL